MMGKFKGVVLTLVVMLAVVFTGTVYSNAKTKSVTITEGKTKTVTTKLTNAVWASSDKTVAKVNSKGKITAVKPGECIIVAVSNGKADIFNVKVSKKSVKGDYFGEWVAVEIFGMRAEDFSKLEFDEAFEVILRVTKKDATLEIYGEADTIDIKEFKEDGFIIDDYGTILTATYDHKKGTLTLEEEGEKMVFVRR